MSLRKMLRAYVAEQIAQPGEHKKAELAAAFLDEHTDAVRDYLRDLAERQVASLIKELCDEPEVDPLPLFTGFPVAIAVAPGVVKATANCTLDDLGAGLTYREDNVRHALERLDAYRDSMAKFDALRRRDDETVGQCAERLRRNPPPEPGREERHG